MLITATSNLTKSNKFYMLTIRFERNTTKKGFVKLTKNTVAHSKTFIRCWELHALGLVNAQWRVQEFVYDSSK